MSDDMTLYAQQLRWLVDEYYHQQITADDYRAQRKLIFDKIEMELAGGTIGSETQKTDSPDEPVTHS